MISPLPVVVFSHGSMMFGLEARCVDGRGLVDSQTASVVPFSALYATDNELEIPVKETMTQWLRLKGSTADWLLGLTNSIDLIELEPSKIYPLPELLVQESRFEPLTALGFYQQRLIALLDVDQLTQLARHALIDRV